MRTDMNFRFGLILFVLLSSFSVANAQQLESYINEAQINNPELRAYNSRVDFAREKVEEVNSLPDTELSAGIFVSE
ncbi:MAG: TolC family protein, partial [Christiangramia sp.]|nr:TolC family protein [Christiangramia sp.]